MNHFGSHIYYVCFYFIYYPLFKKSKHIVSISIEYYLCDSCLYFLIGICTYVAIDIINLWVKYVFGPLTFSENWN